MPTHFWLSRRHRNTKRVSKADRCPVCVHPARESIEKRILSGEDLKRILDDYSTPTLYHETVYIGDRGWRSGSQQKELASGKCTKRWPEDAGPRMPHETRYESGNLSRRLAKLEDDPEQDMVTVTHQWLNEDGTPAGEMIEHRIPRSRMSKFEWIDEK